VRQVCGAWDTFWKAHSAYQQCPGKFTGSAETAALQAQSDGRNLLVYTRQAISRPALKAGRICPSQLDMVIQTKQKEAQQVRIVPHASHYVVEVIYMVHPYPLHRITSTLPGRPVSTWALTSLRL